MERRDWYLSSLIDGQSLPRIYDNFVAQVSGIGEHRAGSMEEIVTLRQQIAKQEADLQKLEKRMRRELQVDIQMQLHQQVRQKRQQLVALKDELENLK